MEAATTTTSTQSTPPANTAPANAAAGSNGAAPNVQSFTPSATTAPINVTAAGTNTDGEWFKNFNDDLKGYVQTKGFKDPQAVVESYKNFEKLMGAPKDKLLKLPEKADAPEWNDVYAKLGRPADAKEYKFDLPKESDPAFEAWARENFHKLGLTKNQAENLMKGYVELSTNQAKLSTEARQTELKAQEDSLKKEWGSAFDQNTQVAKKAATQFGIDGKMIDTLEAAMGYDGVMKFLQNIGSKIGEASYVGSNSPKGFSGILTPEQARNEINELKKDNDFTKKWATGDVESRRKMEQLHKWAYPE